VTIRLRGHHLLCLLGYRGKGYSESFCDNMTEIYERLRLHPETEIEIVEGPDDICRAFPSDQISHCMNDSVFRKDAAIVRLAGLGFAAASNDGGSIPAGEDGSGAGLRVGDRASWAALCEAVRSQVQPEDVKTICADCRWEPFGLCKEGVAHMRAQGDLRPLPGAGNP